MDGTTAGAAERIRRALDEVRASRAELADLGQAGKALELEQIERELAGVLRALDPAAGRAYPEPGER